MIPSDARVRLLGHYAHCEEKMRPGSGPYLYRGVLQQSREERDDLVLPIRIRFLQQDQRNE